MKERILKKVWQTGLMAAVCICVLISFSKNVSAMQSVSIRENITIRCIDGTQYQPQDFTEETVVLVFGRTTCPNTVGMLRSAEEMLKCGASMKLILMDVDFEDAGMESYAQAHPDVIVAHGTTGYNWMMWDLLSEAGIGSGSIILPATFIMDKSRTIVRASTGYVRDEFQEEMEAISPVPHHYVETEETATCSKTGIRYERCSACGKVKPGSEEILPALGHQPGAEATCTEEQVCMRCGEVLQPALGHDWSAWSTVEKATVFAPEKQGKYCRRDGCGVKKTQNVGECLTAFLVLPEDTVSLKVNDTYPYEFWGMQTGDYLVSVTPSENGIVEVLNADPSGSFSLRGLKAGKVVLNVKLASGLSDAITVTVTGAKAPADKTPGKDDTGKTTVNNNKTPGKDDTGKTTVDNKTPEKDDTGKTDTADKKPAQKKPAKKKTVKTTAIKKVPKKIVLKKGKTKTLKPVRVPAKSTQKITFSSSNKKVATVSKKGKITAKKKGTAIITVKSGSKKVKCRVTVKK